MKAAEVAFDHEDRTVGGGKGNGKNGNMVEEVWWVGQ